MMNSIRSALICGAIAVGVCLCTAGRSRAAAPASSPRAVVETVVHDALGILRDGKASVDEKRERVQRIAYDHIDFAVMARLSIGRHWRELSEPQRATYAAEFREYVTNTYRHTTDHYTDEDVQVVGDRTESDGDSTVTTRILGTRNDKPGQELAHVDYRLRQSAGEWKVIDMTIDGVSLVSNFRSQFQEIIASGGVERLLNLLHEKNASNAK